jgi:hypothetical protein
MITDIFSFIIRYVILNPMALIGVCCGSYFMLTYGESNFETFITSPEPYGAAYAIALFYALAFRHIYYPESEKVDWWATVKSSVNHFLTLLFAAACGAIIIYGLNYGLGHKLDKYVRHEK